MVVVGWRTAGWAFGPKDWECVGKTSFDTKSGSERVYGGGATSVGQSRSVCRRDINSVKEDGDGGDNRRKRGDGGRPRLLHGIRANHSTHEAKTWSGGLRTKSGSLDSRRVSILTKEVISTIQGTIVVPHWLLRVK
ncbi:hypothetical protein P3L10_013155 [Capsicum annuum]